MANWQSRLNLKDVWPAAKEGRITPQKLAATIAKRLRRLSPCKNQDILDERDEIADEFEAFSEDPTADTDEFDSIMERLYDWGDIKLDNDWPPKAVCWIARDF